MTPVRRDALIVIGAMFGLAVFAFVLTFVLCWLIDTPAHAAPCTPDLAHWTPTPTIRGDQADPAGTVGYRVYWKRPEDVVWRGSIDVPVQTVDSSTSRQVIDLDYPIQRLVPTAEQLVEVDVMVKAFDAENDEAAPSPIVRVCMPEIQPVRP